MRRSVAALAIAVMSVLACSKDKDKPKDTREELGEAIGAQVPASPKLPSMSIAFALQKGADPVPLLAPFVDAVTKSAMACPEFAPEMMAKPMEPAGFEFALEGGKVKLTGRTDPAPGAKCFAGQLEGKSVGAATMPRVIGRSEILVRAADDAGMP